MVGDLISVIIPVYNREAYLRDCLDSVCGNTYQNLEIIIVNDGSTDKSAEIIDSYASRDKRIVVINQENGGVNSARNMALSIAKGEWISFVDSDDWISRNYFEILLGYTYDSISNVVVCEKDYGYERTPDLNPMATNMEFETERINGVDAGLFLQRRGNVWGILYQRDVIKGLLFDTNVRYAEDRLFNLHIMAYRGEKLRMCLCKAKIYSYWQNSMGADVLLEDENWCIPLIDGEISIINNLQNGHMKFLLSEIFAKAFLSYRYGSMFNKTSQRRENIKKYRKILYSYMKTWPITLRIKYCILLWFPPIYRAFRLVNDKTLLKWEKAQKLKRRNKKTTA